MKINTIESDGLLRPPPLIPDSNTSAKICCCTPQSCTCNKQINFGPTNAYPDNYAATPTIDIGAAVPSSTYVTNPYCNGEQYAVSTHLHDSAATVGNLSSATQQQQANWNINESQIVTPFNYEGSETHLNQIYLNNNNNQIPSQEAYEFSPLTGDLFQPDEIFQLDQPIKAANLGNSNINNTSIGSTTNIRNISTSNSNNQTSSPTTLLDLGSGTINTPNNDTYISLATDESNASSRHNQNDSPTANNINNNTFNNTYLLNNFNNSSATITDPLVREYYDDNSDNQNYYSVQAATAVRQDSSNSAVKITKEYLNYNELPRTNYQNHLDNNGNPQIKNCIKKNIKSDVNEFYYDGNTNYSNGYYGGVNNLNATYNSRHHFCGGEIAFMQTNSNSTQKYPHPNYSYNNTSSTPATTLFQHHDTIIYSHNASYASYLNQYDNSHATGTTNSEVNLETNLQYPVSVNDNH